MGAGLWREKDVIKGSFSRVLKNLGLNLDRIYRGWYNINWYIWLNNVFNWIRKIKIRIMYNLFDSINTCNKNLFIIQSQISNMKLFFVWIIFVNFLQQFLTWKKSRSPFLIETCFGFSVRLSVRQTVDAGAHWLCLETKMRQTGHSSTTLR